MAGGLTLGQAGGVKAFMSEGNPMRTSGEREKSHAAGADLGKDLLCRRTSLWLKALLSS
jgi:hypothetical protein